MNNTSFCIFWFHVSFNSIRIKVFSCHFRSKCHRKEMSGDAVYMEEAEVVDGSNQRRTFTQENSGCLDQSSRTLQSAVPLALRK